MYKHVLIDTNVGLTRADVSRHSWQKYPVERLTEIQNCLGAAMEMFKVWRERLDGHYQSIKQKEELKKAAVDKKKQRDLGNKIKDEIIKLHKLVQTLLPRTTKNDCLQKKDQALNKIQYHSDQLANDLKRLADEIKQANDEEGGREEKEPRVMVPNRQRAISKSLTVPADVANVRSELYRSISLLDEPAKLQHTISSRQSLGILRIHFGAKAASQIGKLLNYERHKLRACVWIIAVKQFFSRKRSIQYITWIPQFLNTYKPDLERQQDVDDFVVYASLARSVYPRPGKFSQDDLKAICIKASNPTIPLLMQGVFFWIKDREFLATWIKSIAESVEKETDLSVKEVKLERLYRIVAYRPNTIDHPFARKWILQAKKQHVGLIVPYFNKWVETTQSEKVKKVRLELVDYLFKIDAEAVYRSLDELVPWAQERKRYRLQVLFGQEEPLAFSLYTDSGKSLQDRITEHARRRCQLFLGMLLYVTGTGKHYANGGPHRGNKTKKAQAGNHLSHSSIFPSLHSFANGQWNVGHYLSHHFSMLTNSTVELPKWINKKIDQHELEGGAVYSFTIPKPKHFGGSRYDVLLLQTNWGAVLDGIHKRQENPKRPRLRAFAHRIVNWVANGEVSVEEGWLQFLIAKYMIVKHVLLPHKLIQKNEIDKLVNDLSKLKVGNQGSAITWRGDTYQKGQPEPKSTLSLVEGLTLQAGVLDQFVEFENDKPVRLKANLVWDHLKGVFNQFDEYKSLVAEVEEKHGGWHFVENRLRYYKKYQEIMQLCTGENCAIAKQMGLNSKI